MDNAGNNPTAANTVNWEYSDSADANLGYVYGRAYLVDSSVGPVVIFDNGYASNSQHAVLYVRDADTGAEIKTFDTGYTGFGPNGCNGMSSPALTDYNFDGVVDQDERAGLDGIIPSREYYSTTLFDPKAFADLLYINDTFGNIIEHPISANPPGLRFWLLNE